MADHEIDNRDTKLELKQNLENLLLEDIISFHQSIDLYTF
jgi:hypothetical protein